MQSKLLIARKSRKETQKDVAKLLDITDKAYQNKESGKSEFTMNEMFILSQHFESSIEDLFLPTKYSKME